MFKNLFPTLVLEEQLLGETFSKVQEELGQLVNQLDFSHRPYDLPGGLQINNSGFNRANNILEDYNLINLKAEVLRCVNSYFNEVGISPNVEVKSVLSTMTKLEPGFDSTKHMHVPSTIVAVYYYKSPTDCGNIRLYSPIPYFEFQKDAYIDVVPTEGKMLVFPGWMIHEVLKNNSQSVRHSISVILQVYEELPTQ